MIGTWGSMGIFIVIALGTLIGIPVAPFYVAAGSLWGVEGLPIVMLGLGVHLLGSLLLTNGVARPLISGILKKLEHKKKLPILEATKMNSLKMTLLIRMFPGVPLCIKSYTLAWMKVPLVLYFIVSLAIESLWALGFMLAGESFMHGQWVNLAGAIAFIILLIFASKNHAGRKKSR